jgi:NAD(P)-dependent dehydrogenase (short-subunit alcohol dehydrogenase family)
MRGKILITGASGGLGIGVSRQLLSEGYYLLAPMLNQENIYAFEQAFSDYRNQYQLFIADLSDRNSLKLVQDELVTATSLVHLAGGFVAADDYASHDELALENMWNINVRSTFQLLQLLVPVFRKRKGGSIVAIGAKAAMKPDGHHAAYAASKAALVNMILSAAEEGKYDHVRANVILPGIIRTPANESWGTVDQMNTWTRVEDIAKTISFLLSDDSKAVNGTSIAMYGML